MKCKKRITTDRRKRGNLNFFFSIFHVISERRHGKTKYLLKMQHERLSIVKVFCGSFRRFFLKRMVSLVSLKTPLTERLNRSRNMQVKESHKSGADYSFISILFRCCRQVSGGTSERRTTPCRV